MACLLTSWQALFDCLYFSRKTPIILTASITEPEAIEVPLQRFTMPQSLKDAMQKFSTSSSSVLQSGKTPRDALYRVRSSLGEEAWKCSWEAGVVAVPENAFPAIPVRESCRLVTLARSLRLLRRVGEHCDPRQQAALVRSPRHPAVRPRTSMPGNELPGARETAQQVRPARALITVLQLTREQVPLSIRAGGV